MKNNRFKAPISVQLILQKENTVLLLKRYNTGIGKRYILGYSFLCCFE